MGGVAVMTQSSPMPLSSATCLSRPRVPASLDRSGSQFKNSTEDLRISRSVDGVTVDRFEKCIFQPTGCGWVLGDL